MKDIVSTRELFELANKERQKTGRRPISSIYAMHNLLARRGVKCCSKVGNLNLWQTDVALPALVERKQNQANAWHREATAEELASFAFFPIRDAAALFNTAQERIRYFANVFKVKALRHPESGELLIDINALASRLIWRSQSFLTRHLGRKKTKELAESRQTRIKVDALGTPRKFILAPEFSNIETDHANTEA